MEEMKEKGKSMMSVASNQTTIGNTVRKGRQGKLFFESY